MGNCVILRQGCAGLAHLGIAKRVNCLFISTALWEKGLSNTFCCKAAIPEYPMHLTVIGQNCTRPKWEVGNVG